MKKTIVLVFGLMLLCCVMVGCHTEPAAPEQSNPPVVSEPEQTEEPLMPEETLDENENADENTEEPTDPANSVPDVAISYFDAATAPESYYECYVDESQYQSDVLLAAKVPVPDFRLVALEYVETADARYGFTVTEELFSVDCFVPEKPLLIHLELPETIPNVGIIYTDRQGETKLYSIAMSGRDGSTLLIEEQLIQ